MADQTTKLHIVVFPWLAMGHMLPCLNLSMLIARKGHRISFLTTPKNIDCLPKLPPNLADYVNFVKFPLPHHEKLPENAEVARDIPNEKIKYLQAALDGLQEPIAEFLQRTSPDWIFHDYVPFWLPSIASKLNIRTALLSTFNAALLGFCGPVEELKGTAEEGRKKLEDFTVKPKWVPFETNIRLKLFEAVKNADGIIGTEEYLTDIFRLGCCIEGCDIIAVRSSPEFEPEWLKLLEDIHKKPIIPVGLLPAIEYDVNHKEEAWESFIKEWLDTQDNGSVVYVALGSEAKPSQAELSEIAFGLELSGLPFFWALRTKRGDRDTEMIELPKGFEERTKDRGVIWTSWAPQLKILSHDSVGGFLTHCGWSSIVETLQFGKATILLPFVSDQGLNARMLEEKNLGYPIPRDELDGSFTRDAVAASLRLVAIEEEGKVYREKVKEVKGLFSDEGRQDLYVENLLGFLDEYKKVQKIITTNGGVLDEIDHPENNFSSLIN